MAKKGVLTVISGFSGVGKGTVVKELFKKYPDAFSLSISATTRKPREGEQDGREYFFVTKRKFKSMIRNGLLLEHAEYGGNFYGTPKEYVEKQLENGKNVILEIDVQGGLQIKKIFPETFLLYIIPPSAEELLRRLRGRGTETEEQIRVRMETAVTECDAIDDYDDVAVNDALSECTDRVFRMITEGERTGADRFQIADKLREELTIINREE